MRAAVRLRDALRAQSIDAGIGVSSGGAVAGNVGTEHRLEYTVMGRPVNEASRLSDHAKQRSSRLLASAATVAEAGRSGWQDAGMLELRGVREPVAVYEPA
jgi:adenylate cyclase